MKKILLGVLLWIFTLGGIFTFTKAEVQRTTDTNSWFTTSWWRDSQNVSYNADVAGKDTFQGDKALKTIQTAINWVLWILSFVALCLCLWWGFQMMTSGGDSKKYESGLNILKWAAIGLAVIACSWLIVSLILYVIIGSIQTKWAWWTGWSTQWWV